MGDPTEAAGAAKPSCGGGHADQADHRSQAERSQTVRDPVCGMTVDPATSEHRFQHNGTTYHFCSARCRGKFAANPEQYLGTTARHASATAAATAAGLQALEQQMGEPGFWEDQERAARISAEHARASRRLSTYNELASDIDDLEPLAELAEEDPEIAGELDDQVASIERRLAQLEEQRLLAGRYDTGDALVTVNSGAGGTDAQDWAEMVLRMEMRWAERRGFNVELLEALVDLVEGAPGSPPGRLLRAHRAAERSVRVIDAHLWANQGQVVTEDDLVRDLAIPAPRLRSAVRKAFGISISRYLLVRRLVALHEMAGARNDGLATRRMLASLCGFWNLGVLEREYEALFHAPFLPGPRRS